MATLIADADGSALPFTGRLMQMMVLAHKTDVALRLYCISS